jgi:hypothetical protein
MSNGTCGQTCKDRSIHAEKSGFASPAMLFTAMAQRDREKLSGNPAAIQQDIGIFLYDLEFNRTCYLPTDCCCDWKTLSKFARTCDRSTAVKSLNSSAVIPELVSHFRKSSVSWPHGVVMLLASVVAWLHQAGYKYSSTFQRRGDHIIVVIMFESRKCPLSPPGSLAVGAQTCTYQLMCTVCDLYVFW